MTEIFRDIISFENHYQVSNLGRVKSLKTNQEKILKGGVDANGYYLVVLCKDGKRKTRTIHQLVAEAFLDHTPNGYNGLIVDHINGDKKDNKMTNLQLITARENISKSKDGVSKYTGVCWIASRGKWQVRIRIKDARVNLGYFDCEHEAGQAYKNKLAELK